MPPGPANTAGPTCKMCIRDRIQTTVLHPKHLEAGAKMVDFHGWEMPINYGSQLEEHHVVRTDAGMFDVSHMTIVDLTGERVKAFLQHLLANDVAKLTRCV